MPRITNPRKIVLLKKQEAKIDTYIDSNRELLPAELGCSSIRVIEDYKNMIEDKSDAAIHNLDNAAFVEHF